MNYLKWMLRKYACVLVSLFVTLMLMYMYTATVTNKEVSWPKQQFIEEYRLLYGEHPNNAPPIQSSSSHLRVISHDDFCVKCSANSSNLEAKSPFNMTWWEAAAIMDCYMNTAPRYTCTNVVAMGNWDVCQDGLYAVRQPCLVYSFGINFDFSFDDAFGRWGCEVHSFDPSMKVDDHRRTANVHFHKIGISHTDLDDFRPRHDVYVREDQTWRVRTLKSIKDMLGHTDQMIDVLKIDVEGTEWSVVEDLLQTGVLRQVKQLLLEWHIFHEWPARQLYPHLQQTYTNLRHAGFLEWQTRPCCRFVRPETLNLQADVMFVNSHLHRT